MADILQASRRALPADHAKVQVLVDAAVNTYKTIRLSSDVVELIGYCEAAFRSLRELRLPQLRPFQHERLNEELQKLAERVALRA